MSARAHTSRRSRVREWQIVTVAFSASSSCAIGLPNRFERPTTTASAPSSSTPALASSSITPARRAGAQAGAPEREQPGVDGRQAIDVLVGGDHRGQRRAVEMLGHGQLQQDPADGRVGVERVELLGDLLEAIASAGRRRSNGTIPTSRHARCLPPT